ncbi:MAG: LuxR C-terminal-related transcriptional regulator [Candidatus Aquilonibacter sp.]
MISEVARPIHRERVSSRFARASEFPLTVVVAPAGCGKSTALEQYLAGVDEPSAIYRVRPGDSTLAQFILGLAQAVGSVFPLELAEAIVKAHANQPVDAAIERMAQVCAMHLRAQGGVLVLDDLHYAQSSEIAQFIHEVVLETKDSLRWILATRSRESLPVGSWLARDLCDLPIDEEALLFTREDVTALARARDMTLSEAHTSAITSATCGLPISVALALRYADSGYDVTELAIQTRLASYEYLTSQMYSEFDEGERRYLCFGALLPTLRIDVFEAAGFADAAKVLNDLYQRSSFLAPRFDAETLTPVEYVCHDLFRDYFRHQLRAQGREEERDLQKRAADALVALGMTTAAIPLYMSSESWNELAANLVNYDYILIDEERRAIIESAIGALRANDTGLHSEILRLRAELALHSKGYNVAEGLFRSAIDCARDGKQRVETLFRFAQHQHLYDTLGAERTLEEVLTSDKCPEDIRALAFAYLLATRTWNDPYYDAREVFAAFERSVNAIESDVQRLDALLFACCAATYCGDPRAERWGQGAIELARAKNMPAVLQAFYGALGHDALYRSYDTAMVMHYAEQQEMAARQIALERGYRACILLKLGLAMRAADVTQVGSLLQTFEAYKSPSSNSARSATTRAEALLHAWGGEFAEAYDLLISVWPNTFGIYRPIIRALCAVFAAAAGRRKELRTLLHEGTAWLRETRPWNEAQLRNSEIARQLYGFAAAVAGRHRDALQLLRESTAFREPCVQALSDVVRAVIGGSAVILAEEDLAFEQLRNLGYGDVALSIRAALKQYQTKDAADGTLTAQQREVLEALAVGLSPKQIAEMMDRRLSTVQGHIRGAVTRLGCSGREQAIRIARSRGLLHR